MSSTFQRVSAWNQLCGKDAPEFGTPEYYEALENQAKRIQEEQDELTLAIKIASKLAGLLALNEYPEAFYHEDVGTIAINQESLNHWNQEILDAGCDLDVVVSGANFLAGHDYDGAIDAVLSNNDVKYTGDIKFAQKSLEALGADTHEIKRVKIDVSDEDQDELAEANYVTFRSDGKLMAFVYSVHRIKDDKICKLLDHPKVDLAPFTKGYRGYTDEEFNEFLELVDKSGSRRQAHRSSSRVALPAFIDKHGKAKCDLMYANIDDSMFKY